MSELNNKKIRIRFEKTGLAKYISHLDLNRLFSRSLARAGIEVAHSEGFNPRPKIVFSSAISLGMESLIEFTDIKITDDKSPEQIFDEIKRVFPDGVNILDVYEPQNDFKNIDNTRFHIYIKPNGLFVDELIKLFDGDIFSEKKSGTIINLKNYICGLIISEELSGYILIDAVLKTNQEMYLNPENIIKSIDINSVEDYYIKKIEIYDKDNNIFR